MLPGPLEEYKAEFYAMLTGVALFASQQYFAFRQRLREDRSGGRKDAAEKSAVDTLNDAINSLKTRLDAADDRAKTWESRYERLQAQFDTVEQERSALYKGMQDALAKITVLESQMGSVKLENDRLRLQNDVQEGEINQNVTKIRTLEQRVRELQSVLDTHGINLRNGSGEV